MQSNERDLFLELNEFVKSVGDDLIFIIFGIKIKISINIWYLLMYIFIYFIDHVRKLTKTKKIEISIIR